MGYEVGVLSIFDVLNYSLKSTFISAVFVHQNLILKAGIFQLYSLNYVVYIFVLFLLLSPFDFSSQEI